MIFAAIAQWLVVAIASTLMIAALVGVAYFIVKGHRRLRAAAERAQLRAFEGVIVADSPAPGLVPVVYHTYYGFLVFTHQTEYRFWATPDDARLVLSRLNHFNLKWGFFAYGALVIPLLSLGNYWAQLARIHKAEGTK